MCVVLQCLLLVPLFAQFFGSFFKPFRPGFWAAKNGHTQYAQEFFQTCDPAEIRTFWMHLHNCKMHLNSPQFISIDDDLPQSLIAGTGSLKPDCMKSHGQYFRGFMQNHWPVPAPWEIVSEVNALELATDISRLNAFSTDKTPSCICNPAIVFGPPVRINYNPGDIGESKRASDRRLSHTKCEPYMIPSAPQRSGPPLRTALRPALN